MSKKLFDYVIGNPPYNADFSSYGDNDTYATPVYNLFLDEAYKVGDKVEMIHPARFLFNAGSTPKAWNEKMLNDEHLKVLKYEEDSSKIFSNTDVKGGIAISYHDEEKKFGPIEIFSKYPEMNSIVKKIRRIIGMESLSDIIFTQCRFDLSALYEKYPRFKSVIGSNGKDKRFRNNIFSKIDIFKDAADNESDIPTLGVIKNKRMWKYIETDVVDQTHENLNKWKTLLARANGSGQFGETLSPSVLSKPGEAYTQTFIGFGSFESEKEANNVSVYLKTKFVRAMLGVLKVTQDNDREVWRLVPLQDFTSQSDIDWSKSISEIDQQLYEKYGLNEAEINFIETHVKEMN